jgi:glucose/arabinose dehydrogenase
MIAPVTWRKMMLNASPTLQAQIRRTILLAGLCLLVTGTSQYAEAEDVSTSFEFNATAPFSVGVSPISADFTAGVAETRGQPQLYISGAFAWHILAGETAEVIFETPASAVDFWVRNAVAGVSSEVRVFDENNVEIASNTPNDMFVAVSVVRAPGETLVGRVEISNSGGGDVVVDDLSFTADGSAPPPGFDPDNPIPEQIAIGSVEVELTEIATGLAAPNFGTYAPGDSSRLFVVDQPGQIQAIDLVSNDRAVFLDVSALLVPLGAFGPDSFDERGLLGLAFHPDYATNGRLYTYTSEPIGALADYSTIPMGSSPDHQSVVREFVTPDPADSASKPDGNSSRVLLRLDEPQFNHNAGALAFDANGYLLISVGDGGGADDVDGQDFVGNPIIGHGTGNGQDRSNPFGTVLRIDPLGNDSANGQYGIPLSNPLVGGAPGDVQEIFAYGFRNPFRMSVDRDTGEIYVADVGQNHIEEVDIVTAGGNYGWNLKEGSFFFDANGNADGFVTDVDPGVPAGLVDPIAEYDHDEGIAIIGGFVYRGAMIPALDGKYVFGDFGSFDADAGRIFYLDDSNRIQAFDVGTNGRLPLAVNGFAEDADGELYVLANATGTPFGDTGTIMRIDGVMPPPPPDDGSDGAGSAPVTGGSGSSGVTLLELVMLWIAVWVSRLRVRKPRRY